jgi:serine/threonine protein kinase/tetratricopeptide (TPR) repeat protein
MGEVYRARDTRLGREVAVKVLPADVATDPERARRFEQEARAASTLNHPNILTVHDIGVDRGIAYLVTELLRGETLRDALSRGAMASERASSIAIQVAHGLAAAHHADIVHRDLKPENLFLTHDGTCKILDFGLARMDRPELADDVGTATPTAGATLAGTVMGTAGYMAPEQVRGHRADVRSDLFSLGVVMHEMLTGVSPFRRDTVVESLNAILKEDPPEIAAATPLSPVIARCLEKEPMRRFQSASDLAFAIESISGLRAASPAGPLPRRRRRAAIVALLLLFVMVPAVWMLMRSHEGPALPPTTRIRSLAVIPFATLSPQSSDEYFAAGMTDALTTELSHIAALKVIGPHSAARLADPSRSRPEVARQLGVEGVVSGSVLRDQDRVRISAQLTEAATDRVVWAENYERSVSDVLALQGEVTRAIVRAIELELSPAEETRVNAATPVDPRALDEYLKGRYLWSQRTEESVRSALRHFQTSAQIAPDFALAYAGIADSYLILAAYNYMEPVRAAPLAVEALTSSMALDSTSGETHATRGDLAFHFERNYALALREADRAVALSPGYATAHNWRSEVLLVLGRIDESIAEIETAISLDPVTPFPRFFLGFAYEAKGDTARAEMAYRDALKVAPTFSLAVLYERFLIRHGRGEEALALARKVYAANTDAPTLLNLGVAQAMTGQRGDAIESLARARAMARERWVSPFEFAPLEAALGHRDNALRDLRAAIEARDFSVPTITVALGPEFDWLKDDSELQQLIDSVRR